VRPSHQIGLVIAAILATVALVPALMPNLGTALFPKAVEPQPLPPPGETQELVVMIRPGPVVYFPGPDGTPVGFDADLARRFAAELQLPLRFVTVDSAARLIAAVARGQAHLGAGGLFRPRLPPSRPAAKDGATGTRPGRERSRGFAAKVLWSAGFATVEPLLIYNSDSYKPTGWRDLDGATVAYLGGTGLDSDVRAVAARHPGVRFRGLDGPSAIGLLAQVSDGSIGYAIVGSLTVAAARNVYLDFEVAFPAGEKRELAWIVPSRYPRLLAALDRFLAHSRSDGLVDRLAERYVPDARAFARPDASAFLDSIRTLLPQWKAMFGDAQAHTGVEWRLLAAIAYQESKWDPYAVSETGVRGFMQITEETAKQLGIADLLDPGESVLGAARYLRDLKSKLPARIGEPDRTWLALAAFNIGLGHLEDARVLAQKQKLNPDLWSDVRKALPLLALPEFHAGARNGYARGGMPVAFVDRVRAYYDILLAHQPALQPRLQRRPDPEPPPPAAR
jgi:membrane-bound lytic murein transglycosylase F